MEAIKKVIHPNKHHGENVTTNEPMAERRAAEGNYMANESGMTTGNRMPVQEGIGHHDNHGHHDGQEHHYGRDAAVVGAGGFAAHEAHKHHHNKHNQQGLGEGTAMPVSGAGMPGAGMSGAGMTGATGLNPTTAAGFQPGNPMPDPRIAAEADNNFPGTNPDPTHTGM